MNVNDVVREYLDSIKLMQLATSVEDRPWLCSVWYVWDYELKRIYFTSRKTRRHSQEIERNPHVACTFVRSFVQGLGEAGQALIVEGGAALIRGQDCDRAYKLYAKRHPKLQDMQSLEGYRSENGSHFFYAITPENVVWWDEINFPQQSKQKISFL